MKVRESGMPDERMWEGFFDPPHILKQLDFIESTKDVVEFGCGYGTFTLPAAALTSGTVYAIDIEPQMIEATARKVRGLGLRNVQLLMRDFVTAGTGLLDASVGSVMLFNILHAEQPLPLVRESFRILSQAGRIAVMHWIHDPSTPRGPDLSIRPRPEQCQTWLRDCGFELLKPFVSLPPYHYGIVGQKPG